MIEIGDTVEHKIFGVGLVQNIDKDCAYVLFENTNEIKQIVNRFLTLIKKADKKNDDVCGLKIYPKDYNEIEGISSRSKELAFFLNNQEIEGELYLDVSLFDDVNRKFSFIVSSKGLTIFEFVEFDEFIFTNMKDLLLTSFDVSKNSLIAKIRNHLSLSKELIADNDLIFSIKHYLYIDEEHRWLIPNLIDKKIEYLDNHQIYSENRESVILDKHTKIIANMLAPQYVVVLTRNSNHLNPKLKKQINTASHANGIELSILKDEQITTLHSLESGIELLLANAGAGKSVILLAKAYELSSIGYKNVLLTCYNSNLSEEYKYKSEECGLNDKQDLYIMTFHKFVIKYCKDIFFKEFEIENINEAVEYLIEKIISGKKIVKFDAIFVDEMQIFEPKWLDLCYMLLNEPKKESYFILAGDVNQDVKGISKDATLNIYKTKYIPRKEGTIKIKYLNYNYRNTIQITEVLNKMLINHTQLLRKLNVHRVDKIENYILGESITNGPKPKYIKTERMKITNTIVNEVIRLKETHKLHYGDIAVIFPYQERTGIRYYLSTWLIEAFNKEGIPFNFIFGDNNKTKVSQIDGVVLSTVDSSLGLDFKAVIICGLFTLTTNNFELTPGNLKRMKIGGKQSKKYPEQFNEFILIEGYKLYIGCSRAREYLTVINDICEENMLVDSIFRGCF